MKKISMKNEILRKGLYSSLLLASVIVPATLAGNTVHATGYVSSPPSRAYYGHTLAPSTSDDLWGQTHDVYGNAMDNYQNMVSSKTFLQLPDGAIASADNSHPDSPEGELKFSLIDNQSSDAWVKQDMKYGKNAITWTNTQPQATKSWQYFITNKEWDPDQPLSTQEFIPLADENGHTEIKPNGDTTHDMSATHNIIIPDDVKAGYNIIVAVWNLDGQQNSYYQAIDVNVQDQTPPSVPANVKATAITCTTATLTWDASKDDHTPAKNITYKIYQDGVTKPIATVKDTSYKLTGLTPDTTTKYTVTATDEVGNESKHSDSVSVKTIKDTIAPDQPVLKVDKKDITTLDVSWAQVNDNVGVTQYKLYKNGEVVTTIDATKPTNYHLTGLDPDTAYKLKVVAFDKAENTSTSEEVNAKTLPDTIKPDKIANFRAENVTKNAMTLKWDAGRDNVAVTGYTLYRDGKKIKDLSASQLEFTDTGLAPGTSYTYEIEAKDAAGNLSDKASLTQKTSTPNVKMHLNLDLTNPGEGDGPHGYEFYTYNGYLTLEAGDDKQEVARFFKYKEGDSSDWDNDSYTYDKDVDYSLMKEIKLSKKLYIWGGIEESDWGNADDLVMYSGYHTLNVTVSADGTKVTATGTFSGDSGDGHASFTITFTEQ